MGLNTGAWSGVLVAMVLFGQHLTAITFTAMAGGILTSLLIWAWPAQRHRHLPADHYRDRHPRDADGL